MNFEECVDDRFYLYLRYPTHSRSFFHSSEISKRSICCTGDYYAACGITTMTTFLVPPVQTHPLIGSHRVTTHVCLCTLLLSVEILLLQVTPHFDASLFSRACTFLGALYSFSPSVDSKNTPWKRRGADPSALILLRQTEQRGADDCIYW